MLLDDLAKLTEWHRLACRFYCDYTDSIFTSAKTPTSLADLPYLPVRAFKQFDLEHQGKISLENLKQVSRELGENMTDEELMEMISAADLDKDGLINEDEFWRIMKKGV